MRRLGCHFTSVLLILHCISVNSEMLRVYTRRPERALLRVSCRRYSNELINVLSGMTMILRDKNYMDCCKLMLSTQILIHNDFVFNFYDIDDTVVSLFWYQRILQYQLSHLMLPYIWYCLVYILYIPECLNCSL